MGDLGQVGREERHLDGQEHDGAERDQPLGPVPEQPCDCEEQDRVENERARDRDPVGRGERDGGSEAEHQHDHGHEQAPVNRWSVDLADHAL